MLNICMVGHGMMGVWHSEALRRVDDAQLHTVVGRPAKPAGESPATPTVGSKPPTTETFAEKYGYKKWTTNLGEALEDPEVDVVIIAGPSETHAEMALASLEHGKHTLVEIPIAMNLDGAERVVAAAKEKGLTLGVVHPMRFRQERLPIVERIHRGEERVSHVQGRFFIHRLSNVGATGLQRSWTDNLLWHHTTHLIDFGLWMVSGGDMATADARIRNIYSAYPPIEPRTGIPMELALVVETHDDQTIVCHRLLLLRRIHLRHPRRHRPGQLPGQRTQVHPAHRCQGKKDKSPPRRRTPNSSPRISCGPSPRVTNRRCPGWSVLPAMRVLHRVQSDWDAKHGAQFIPGRPFL